MESEQNNKVLELNYVRASAPKRVSSMLFDLLLCFVSTIILLIGTFAIIQTNSGFISLTNDREEGLLSSQLYIKSDNEIKQLSSVLDSDDTLTYNEKSEKLDAALTSFFNNDLFFYEVDGNKIYLDLKKAANNGDSQELLFNSEYERALTNSDYDKTYYDFYTSSFSTALGYLQLNKSYSSATKKINIVYIFSTIGTFLFTVIIFFYIVPLICKRGRQTLGMKLTKIGVVSSNGFNLSFARFTARFCLFFFVELILSLVSFLIPVFVSLTMMVIRKDHQSFHDYIVQSYVVTVDNDTIYLDYEEYQEKHREIDIQNIVLKQ
jgi:uncharacterized RDD family membrane protein YckC